MRARLVSALLCSGFWLSGVAVAQQTGAEAEAQAMLQMAVTEMKASQAAAIAKFNKTDGEFRYRDLYVYCFEVGTGKFTAHVNPALIGKDVRSLKEKDGSPLGQKVYDAAKEGVVTTISYNFPKPGGTDPVPKEAYVTRVGDQGCGVGYYK
jgi:signal transduction histidine kinase